MRHHQTKLAFVCIPTGEFGLINIRNVSLVNSPEQGGGRLRTKSPSHKTLVYGCEQSRHLTCCEIPWSGYERERTCWIEEKKPL